LTIQFKYLFEIFKMWQDKKLYKNYFKFDRHDHYFNQKLNCIMCISNKNKNIHCVTSPDNLYNLGKGPIESQSIDDVNNEKVIIEKCSSSNWCWRGKHINVPIDFYYQDQAGLYILYQKQILNILI